MKNRWMVCAAALLAPGLAAAGDETGHWYLDPQVGALSTDYRRDTHNSVMFGGALGYNIYPYFSTELNVNSAKVGDRFDSGHLKLGGLSIDFLAILNRNNAFAPFLSIGGGVVREAPSGFPVSNRGMGEAGVGALWKLWEADDESKSVSLRPEIKARFDSVARTHTTDYIGLLGLQYSFGPGKPPPPAAAASAK